VTNESLVRGGHFVKTSSVLVAAQLIYLGSFTQTFFILALALIIVT